MGRYAVKTALGGRYGWLVCFPGVWHPQVSSFFELVVQGGRLVTVVLGSLWSGMRHDSHGASMRRMPCGEATEGSKSDGVCELFSAMLLGSPGAFTNDGRASLEASQRIGGFVARKPVG